MLIEIILLGVCIYIFCGSSKKGNCKGSIKYDKRNIRTYLWLAVISLSCFVLSILLFYVWVDVIRNDTRDKILFTIAANGIWMGFIGTLVFAYQCVNGFFYLRRLKKKGYQVPADKRVYEGLESLPKRDDFGQYGETVQGESSYEKANVSEQGKISKYSPTSNILLYVSIISLILMLCFSGYYFYKWHFMGESAIVLFVLQLILDGLWLIIIRIFYKQMDNEKYRDDVEIDITRKVRMNMVSGLTLLIVILLGVTYIKLSAHSMTEYTFKSGWIKDKDKMIDIYAALEISCYEMDYFWADSREWQETKRILENGVDITSWGIPRGDLQEKVAAMLDITDFGQLKEAFHSTDGPAVVYVRLEGEKVIVELQNLYPVADKIVISE